MRKLLLWAVILVSMTLGVSVVAAADQVPPPGSPADNECNPGGVLYREENQDGCPTEWYWKAGWFLARYNRGEISREEFPDEFKSVLPPTDTLCGFGYDSGQRWTSCVSTNQTGYEEIDGEFYSYLLFVDSTPSCPSSYNGINLLWTTDTYTYMTVFYNFDAESLNNLGGLRAVTCIYGVL